MKLTFPVSPARRLLRAVLRSIFRVIFSLFCRVKITGRENLPETGAYIIAFNHVSLFEAPFLIAFWSRAVEAAGASDLWERPGIAILVHLYGGIPVRRGEYDRELMKSVLQALQAGCPILVAPEGTRSHQPGMQRAHPGIAYIADQASAPILPVGIVGTTEDLLTNALRLKRPSLEMHIGKPFRLPALTGKGAELRKARQSNADLIMRKIARLLPPAYQGYYQIKPNESDPQLAFRIKDKENDFT